MEAVLDSAAHVSFLKSGFSKGGEMHRRDVLAKKVAFLLMLALLVLVFVACGGAAAPTSAPPTNAPAATSAPAATTAPSSSGGGATGSVIKIGLLTDDSGSLAIYGPMLERGFQLGLDYATEGTSTVAGKQIQVITKDTASKTDVGQQVARDLLEKENVDILVGAPNSGVTLAVADLAKQYKKILIAQPAASPDLTGKAFNPYVFRTSRTSVQDALTMGAALTKLGKKFVQIAPDYAFGYGSAAGFYSVVKGNGGQFVVNDTADKSGAIFIPQDAKDFTPYLQKVLDTKADVLIVTWAGAGFVPLFTQMQQLGVFKAMTVATGMGDNQTLKNGYVNAIGSVGVSVYHYALPKNKINDWLVQKHKEKFGTPPDLFTEGGFTAAQMVVAGLKATNGDATGDTLIPVLEKLSFEGPKGTYKVRDYDHVMLQTMYLVKLSNVTDPDFKFFDLIQELKPEDTAPPCALQADYQSRCPK
jgi:branched-chain amino acid transport system substrate-binding protein